LVDRVYKAGIPRLRRTLERLREDFSDLRPRTDWTSLRIEPLLDHARSLERLLESQEFGNEFSRLTKGVAMFRSDLDYFRTNVRTLETLLQAERRRSTGRNNRE